MLAKTYNQGFVFKTYRMLMFIIRQSRISLTYSETGKMRQ